MLLDTLWESFRASGALAPSKRQGFLEPGALDLQKVVSHLCWGHWRFRHVVFSRSGALWLQRPVLSRAWAVLAIKIVPKITHRAPFCCNFWRVGSKVSFSLLFVNFLEGPTLDPLAQAQSTRSFFIFGVASKRVSFLQQLLEHFWSN